MKNLKKKLLISVLFILPLMTSGCDFTITGNINNDSNKTDNDTVNNDNNTKDSNLESDVNETTDNSKVEPSETNKENTETDTIKTVKYVFTTADRLAMSGNPGILNIYELSDSKIEFDYNHGWNFEEMIIDRKVSGTAFKNSEGLYEYKESIDGYEYKITIKYNEDQVILREYKDENFYSATNLWS